MTSAPAVPVSVCAALVPTIVARWPSQPAATVIVTAATLESTAPLRALYVKLSTPTKSSSGW